MSNYYAQRDERWKNEKLGTSNTTIGTHGCLISCLGSLIGSNPSQVNQALKKVNGYSNGNLVNWSYLNKIGFKFIKRVREYNNDEVKDNLPCVVEVNGARIGATQHWVLYIGGGQMWDPWFGNIKSTNYYSPTGYAVVNGIIDPTPYIGEPMPETDIRIKILNEEKIKTETEIREAVARYKGWEALQKDKRNADIKIDLLQDEIKKLKSDLESENKANIARVNAEKEQNRNILRSVAEATGSNQSLPEILQGISILRSAEDNKDRAERAEKQAKEDLSNEKLRHSETSDKLQNATNSLLGSEKELKAVKSALEKLTVINNKNNMAKKNLNPVLEALKEPLRLCVLAIIPFGIAYFAGFDAVWAVGATVLLKTLDKYLHKSGKLELGITRF